jgi:orotidine-5'-phosphate decarboxylase
MDEQSKKTMEVVKFAFSVGIPLIAGAIGYGALQNRVSTIEKGQAKLEVRVEAVEAHNQRQDVETAAFRSNMTTRVERIEKLTEDIHSVVVGRAR